MTLNPHFEQDRRLSYDIVAYELEPAYRHQAADTTFSDPSHRMIVASSRLDREGNARVPTIARYDRPTSTWLPLTSLDEHPFGPMVVIGSYDGLLMIWSDSSEPGLLRTSVISSDGARRDVPVPAGLDGVPTRIYRFAYPDRTLALLAFDEGAAALNLDRSGAPTGPVQDLGNSTIDSSLWMTRPDGTSLFLGYDGSTVRVDRQGRVETGRLPRSLPSDPTEGSFYINGPGIVIQRGDTVRWFEDLWDEEAAREVVVPALYGTRELGGQLHRDSAGYFCIVADVRTIDDVGIVVERIRFDSVSGEVIESARVAKAGGSTTNITAYVHAPWFEIHRRFLHNGIELRFGAIAGAKYWMTHQPWERTYTGSFFISESGVPDTALSIPTFPFAIVPTVSQQRYDIHEPVRTILDPWRIDTHAVRVGGTTRHRMNSALSVGFPRGIPSLRWMSSDSTHLAPVRPQFDGRDSYESGQIVGIDATRFETPSITGIVTWRRSVTEHFSRQYGPYTQHDYAFFITPDIGRSSRYFFFSNVTYGTQGGGVARPILLDAAESRERLSTLVVARYGRGAKGGAAWFDIGEYSWTLDTIRRVSGLGSPEVDTGASRLMMLSNDTALIIGSTRFAVKIPGSKLITFAGDTTWTTRWIGPISRQRIVRIVGLTNGTSDAIIYNVDGSIRHRQTLDRLPDGGIDVHEIPASGDLLIVGSASETVSGDLPVLLLDGYLRELQVGGQPLRSIALFTDAERAIDRRLLLFGDTLVGAYIDSVDRQVYMNAVLLSEFGGLSSVDSEEGSENARRRDRMLHRIDLTSVEVGLNFARIVVGEHCVDTSIIHYDQ